MTKPRARHGYVGMILSGWLVALPGCERAPHLASGPFDIGPQPQRVQFDSPVSAAGDDWEFCFEFDIPGDSHRTRSIGVTLLTVDDRAYQLDTSSLDRRGESTVCLIGRVDDLAPGVVIGAVELVAPITTLGARYGDKGLIIVTAASLEEAAAVFAAFYPVTVGQSPPPKVDPAPPPPSVELPKELARVLTDYEKAWSAKDAGGLAALFAEDGFVMPGGRPPVRGRAAIEKHYAGQGGALSLRAFAWQAGETSGRTWTAGTHDRRTGVAVPPPKWIG